MLNGLTFVCHLVFAQNVYLLEHVENASQYFALFLQTVYAIEKLLAGFSGQPRIGVNQSLI